MPRLALVLTLLLAGACGGRSPGPAMPEQPISLALPALDGGVIDVTSYRGKVVVLHIFATWVPAVHLDTSELIEVHERYRDRLVVIGVAIDPDGHPVVAPWRRAVEVPYLIALDPGPIRDGKTSIGRIQELPTTLVLDTDGRAVARIDRSLQPGELPRLVSRFLPDDGGG